MNKNHVMERTALPAGKIFIKENEEHGRAYVIQTGKVQSFQMKNGEKVIIKEYGPNTIIGEANLFEDALMTKSYEAIEQTTVITITKHDFEKRLQKTDTMIETVFKHLVLKLQDLSVQNDATILRNLKIDEYAYKLVEDMTKDVSEFEKREYELAMLPHVNALVKSVQKLKDKKIAT